MANSGSEPGSADLDPIEEWAEDETSALDLERANHDRQLRALRAEVRQAKAIAKIEAERADRAQAALDLALALDDRETHPVVIPTRVSTRNVGVAFAIASDWHVGEDVDPAKVDGENAYHPKVAQARSERFFQNTCRLIELSRHGADVDTLVLGLLGDLVTGYIHEELVESNNLAPIDEVDFAADLVIAGIHSILDRLDLQQLIVPCVPGNHGRMTTKTRYSTLVQNNLETLIYRRVRREFETDDRVEVIVPAGPFVFLELFGRRIRFCHGDTLFKYGGGVGGLYVPILRKLGELARKGDTTFHTFMGHFHQLTFDGSFTVNGSLIGNGGYSYAKGYGSEPARQAFRLLDRDRGWTLSAPIFVQDPSDLELKP